MYLELFPLSYVIVKHENSDSFRLKRSFKRIFKRSSVLISGTKEEMEAAVKEHTKIVNVFQTAKNVHHSNLKEWLERYQKK